MFSFSRAEDDLRRATKLAYAQIEQYGMRKTSGLISFPADQQNPQNDDFGTKPYSKRLQRMMDEVDQTDLMVLTLLFFLFYLGSTTTSSYGFSKNNSVND